MAGTINFTCNVIPTRTTYPNPWLIDRSTTDDHGGGITIRYEGQFVFSTGQWWLYITVPGTQAPFSRDFKDGDSLDCCPPHGTVATDKGVIAEHVSKQVVGTYWITVYSYTANMVGLTP